MDFFLEVVVQVVGVAVLGAATSFVVWRLKGRGESFGEFLEKYGEMLAYAGLFVVVIVLVIVQLIKE